MRLSDPITIGPGDWLPADPHDYNRCEVCDEPITVDDRGCEFHADLLELTKVELIRELEEARQKLVHLWATGGGAA